jgi:hypothetical protein
VKFAAIALALLSLGACSKGPPMAPVGPPTISYQSAPMNSPGYISTCAGGQPNMNYNCPASQH